MREKRFGRNGPPPLVLGVLFSVVALCGVSCDLPESPKVTGGRFEAGTGVLTLILPRTRAVKSPGVSRSVLSGDFIEGLKYRLTLTGAPGTTVREVEGGETVIPLMEGEWTIVAEAYVLGAPETTVGSGSIKVDIGPGENASRKISLKVDPNYEGALAEIYIHNEEELRRIGAAENGLAIDMPDRIFYLESDIVLSQPWSPIGSPGEMPSPDKPFKAVFDGQGHSITVKSFAPAKKATGAVYQGFFALAEDAVIKNITVKYELDGEEVDIKTGAGSTYNSSYAGGLVGRADETAFENVRVTGDFSVIADRDSNLNVGGIVGGGDNITITDCFTEGRIKAEAGSPRVGGIAGALQQHSSITKSYALGAVEGVGVSKAFVGGIAGESSSAAIENCYAGANVRSRLDPLNLSSVDVYAGGIAGRLLEGSISKCYAVGTVNVDGAALAHGGGIVGEALLNSPPGPPPQVSGCMALISELRSEVFVPSRALYHIGGSSGGGSYFAGNYARNDLLVFNNNFNPNPGLNNNNGETKPLADFKSQAVYVAAGWNFDDGTGDWKLPPSDWEWNYPALSWQTAAPGGALEESSKGGAGLVVEWP